MAKTSDTPDTDETRPPDPLAHPARDRADALVARAADESTEMTRFQALSEIAGDYGDRAFKNYSQIRNVAQTIRDSLREYMCSDGECTFLVPPSGKFGARDYGSGAFSVAGKGFLPLEPLSFGLAVRVSDRKDYIRIVMTCRKEADVMYVTPDNRRPYRLSLPPTEEEIADVTESIYDYLVDWFASRIDRYDNGTYGNNDIGFDIVRAAQ